MNNNSNSNSNGGDEDELLWVTDKIKEVIRWAHELAMYKDGHRQVSIIHIAASLIWDRHGLFYQAIDQDVAETIKCMLFKDMIGPPPPPDSPTTIRVLLKKVRAKSNCKRPIDERLLILFVLEDSRIRFILKRRALKVGKLKSQVVKLQQKQQKILAKNNSKVLDRFRTKKKKKKNLLNPFSCSYS